MNKTLEWLPRPTYRERKERFQELQRTPPQKQVARFSEFLSPDNILFFSGSESKVQIVEALVGTLQGHDPKAALQAIWNRERDGVLGIQPDISIVRGRIERVHHLRAALALCPKGVFDPSNPSGKTRLFVLFVGPNTQTHLHANFLVAVSALFHDRRLVEKLLKSKSPEKVLKTLQEVEGMHVSTHPLKSFFFRIFDFFRIHYGWGPFGTA